MTTPSHWLETAAGVIYEAYPDHDLLPIEPPRPEETVREFKARAQNSADTLFLFLCREADDQIDVHEYLARLDRAIRDIEAVRDAFREQVRTLSPVEPARAKAGPDVTIRLSVDDDWIELGLGHPDVRGRRSGTVRSTLHTTDDQDDRFNAAMDAIESLVLAHACALIDVTDPRYVEGIRTSLAACTERF